MGVRVSHFDDIQTVVRIFYAQVRSMHVRDGILAHPSKPKDLNKEKYLE